MGVEVQLADLNGNTKQEVSCEFTARNGSVYKTGTVVYGAGKLLSPQKQLPENIARAHYDN